MTETELLEAITEPLQAAGLTKPADIRAKLVTNPRAKRWKLRDVAALKGMVWHQELGWGSVESVAKYHTGKESHLAQGGVASIAYTAAIRRNGQVVLCNPLDRAVWSQGFKGRPGDENKEFLSVMFEGLFTGPGVTDPSAGAPSEAQITAATLLWRTCRDEWEWTNADLYGHYHFGKPACPGTVLQQIIEAIRADVDKPRYDLSTVKGRQQALKDLGHYEGRIEGKWGPRSRGALIAFQELAGIVPDGVWGPITQAAIVKALAVRPA